MQRLLFQKLFRQFAVAGLQGKRRLTLVFRHKPLFLVHFGLQVVFLRDRLHRQFAVLDLVLFHVANGFIEDDLRVF